VGDRVPKLELATADGELVRLSDFIGTPVLLSFLSHAA
jgi:peroxiredoxin